MFRIDSEHVIDATISGGPARWKINFNFFYFIFFASSVSFRHQGQIHTIHKYTNICLAKALRVCMCSYSYCILLGLCDELLFNTTECNITQNQASIANNICFHMHSHSMFWPHSGSTSKFISNILFSTRYINHSCAPNCIAEVVSFERGHKIIISSNRRIQRGEEVKLVYPTSHIYKMWPDDS